MSELQIINPADIQVFSISEDLFSKDAAKNTSEDRRH